jgi:hypothetical protein
MMKMAAMSNGSTPWDYRRMTAMASILNNDGL